MASAQRVSDEPAFILHRYDWSESSLILEVFTRHRGRVALVAKGAKKHTSNFRPVLLGLQPLRLTYTLSADGQGDIHTLRGAEWAGGHIMPMGSRLLSGLYVNELLLRLLARDDPYAYVFDVYAALIKLLATQHDVVQEPALRAFELVLLRELGLLPALHEQTVTLQPLQAAAPYTLAPEVGLRPAEAGERSLTGAQWQALEQALSQGDAAFAQVLHASASLAAPLKPQLRQLLQFHCGMLRTRQLMMDLHTL